MMNNIIHTPVLLNEIIANLNINKFGTYLDCTAGFGGHSQEILKSIPEGKLICLDQDFDAINYLKKLFYNKKNVQIVHGNFINLNHLIKQKCDGIIFDLGVSSFMLDNPLRGFSYNHDGPLDMRMDNHNHLTAKMIVNTYSPKELNKIFTQYTDEKDTWKVVNSIIQQRQNKPIISTLQLANIICQCKKTINHKKHPAKVYFQALRIETNNEIVALKEGLKQACELLKKRGRLLIISFHSIEDRIVKEYFKQITSIRDLYEKSVPLSKLIQPKFKLITKKVIIPTEHEIKNNHRCHSAKLRIIERI